MWADLTTWDTAAIVVKLAVYCGSFLAMGSVIFIVVNRGLDPPLIRLLKRVTLIGAAIAVCGSAIQFFIQCGRLADEGLSGMLDPDMIELVAGAPLGEAVAWRVVGLILLCAIALPPTITKIAAVIGVVIAAISFSRVGHGTEEPKWLLGPLVSIHLLAVAFWIGALLPLRRLARHPENLETAARLAHSFGQQAAIVVGLLIFVGLFLAWWLVETPANLLLSQYGNTLLVKLVVVAGLMGLAAANKLRFVPNMMAGSFEAATHFRRSIKFEAVAIATILTITAILTTVTSLPTMEGHMEGETTMDSMDHDN